MPIVDMPLEELKKYRGSSPCPADIDEYWDNAIAEMKALDYNAEFIKADFESKGIEYYDLYFTGTKNARLHAKFAKPANIEGKVPAVLMFHGLSGSSCEWSGLIQYASQGYCVAFLDTRGQAGYSEDVGGVPGTTYSTPFMRGFDGDKNDLPARENFLDTALLARVIMDLDYVDENRVGATGGSQGGALTVACAALEPRIKLCAPVYPYLSDYKRVWNMDLAKGAYEGLKYYFRHYDPTHEREDEIFEKLGYIDIQNISKRIKAEVLMFTGLMDTTCPPSTQFAMYNNITSKKDVVIYPDYGHEGLKGSSDKIFKFLSNL
ncbi:MAG: acetylxylan esterase [Clostridia bacterium]|nr:acetylxylan esterase [Clostridia bacterium]